MLSYKVRPDKQKFFDHFTQNFGQAINDDSYGIKVTNITEVFYCCSCMLSAMDSTLRVDTIEDIEPYIYKDDKDKFKKLTSDFKSTSYRIIRWYSEKRVRKIRVSDKADKYHMFGDIFEVTDEIIPTIIIPVVSLKAIIVKSQTQPIIHSNKIELHVLQTKSVKPVIRSKQFTGRAVTAG